MNNKENIKQGHIGRELVKMKFKTILQVTNVKGMAVINESRRMNNKE